MWRLRRLCRRERHGSGAVLLTSHAAIFASLCLACCGIYAALAVFWTLPSSLLRGTAAAAGLALLNSFSNLGGFFGPFLMGWAGMTTPATITLGMMLLAPGCWCWPLLPVIVTRAGRFLWRGPHGM